MPTPNNKQVQNYPFLAELYQKEEFPDALVDQGKELLLQLCINIEAQQPATVQDFYALTQATTAQFNELEGFFEVEGEELEELARESIALDMVMISLFYGYEAEAETMIANRNW